MIPHQFPLEACPTQSCQNHAHNTWRHYGSPSSPPEPEASGFHLRVGRHGVRHRCRAHRTHLRGESNVRTVLYPTVLGDRFFFFFFSSLLTSFLPHREKRASHTHVHPRRVCRPLPLPLPLSSALAGSTSPSSSKEFATR